MELINNLFQFAVTLLGFCLSGIWYLKDRKQTCFLLTCFYGCFALGSLYWTLYLLLFSETPQVFYVSEFGWIASVISFIFCNTPFPLQRKETFRHGNL